MNREQIIKDIVNEINIWWDEKHFNDHLKFVQSLKGWVDQVPSLYEMAEVEARERKLINW